MESHLRSVAKAVTWRVGGSIFTALIAWAVTRETRAATTIGLADLVVKIAAFYIHERAGRWIGTSKCGGECGIHTRPLKGNYQI